VPGQRHGEGEREDEDHQDDITIRLGTVMSTIQNCTYSGIALPPLSGLGAGPWRPARGQADRKPTLYALALRARSTRYGIEKHVKLRITARCRES